MTAERTRGREADSKGLQLTPRDVALLGCVLWAKACTAEQLQMGAGYSLACRRPCQRRLTLLVRHRYLDRLPRQVNEPAVYVLSRRSPAGNQLLKERFGEEAFRQQLATRVESLEHTLAINDVRMRVQRACRELGWELTTWHSSPDLLALLHGEPVIPDGFFQIERVVAGETKTASFFLEVERMSRDSRVLREKLEKYGRLYYTGKFTELFGTRALRLLVVYAEGTEQAMHKQLARSVAEAQRSGVTIAHFASLQAVKQLGPTDLLIAPVWSSPRSDQPLALFPLAAAAPSATAAEG